MATIGKLVVSLRANSAQLVTELNKSRSRLKSFSADAAKYAKAGALAAGAIGTAAVAGIVTAVNKGAAEIDRLAKGASKLNIDVGSLQRFEYAANLSGVAASTLEKGLEGMVRRVSEATEGTGEAVDALAQLNINADELNRLKPDQQFLQIAEALRQVTNENDRARLAYDIFGRSGMAMMNLLNADVRALGEEFATLGGEITNQQAKMVEAYQDSKTKLTTLFGSFRTVLSAELAGPFKTLVDEISGSIIEMGGLKSAAQTTARFMVSVISGVVKAVGWLAESWLQAELFMARSEKVMMRISNIIRTINPLMRFFMKEYTPEEFAQSTLNINAIQKKLEEGVPQIQQKVQDVLAKIEGTIGAPVNLNDVVTNMIADGLSGQERENFLNFKKQEASAADQAAKRQLELADSAAAAAKTLEDVSKSKAWQDIFGKADVTARSAEFDKYARLVKGDIESGSRFAGSNLGTLKQILETARNNQGMVFSNQGNFERVDVDGMAEVVRGLEAMMAGRPQEAANQQRTAEIFDSAGNKFESSVNRMIDQQNNQPVLGQLNIDMTTDTGKVAGKIFGEPEFLMRLKEFVDRNTANAARQQLS